MTAGNTYYFTQSPFCAYQEKLICAIEILYERIHVVNCRTLQREVTER